MKNVSSHVKLLASGFRNNVEPSILILFITEKCNLRCDTCFNWENLSDGKNDLTFEEIRKLSLTLKPISRLLLSGGEPFMRDDLVDVLKMFQENNGTFDFHIPTNGIETEKIMGTIRRFSELSPKTRVTVSVGVDGLKETHEKVKGLKGGFDKTMVTMKEIDQFAEENPMIFPYAITVVSQENINEIVELNTFIRSNFKNFLHGPSPIRGEPKNNNLKAPTSEEWKELTDKLDIFNVGNPEGELSWIQKSRINYLREIVLDVLDGKNLPFQCSAGNSVGVIDANGDVRLCELTPPVGNLRESGFDFKSVWFSERANSQREQIKECGCCHSCFIVPAIDRSPKHLLKSLLCG